jgi:hypothetical protein
MVPRRTGFITHISVLEADEDGNTATIGAHLTNEEYFLRRWPQSLRVAPPEGLSEITRGPRPSLDSEHWNTRLRRRRTTSPRRYCDIVAVLRT